MKILSIWGWGDYTLCKKNVSCYWDHSCCYLSSTLVTYYVPNVKTTISLNYHVFVNCYIYLYRRELYLAISSSPVKNNNVQFLFGRTATV